MFESPVFRQIHPTVVLILPAAVPQLADKRSGKYLLGQSGDPESFVVGGMRNPFSFAVAIAIEHLFGARHPHRFGVVDGEGQTFGIPELNLLCLMVAPLRTEIRWSRCKQAHRRLIQITGVLLQADDCVPAHPVDQLQYRSLRVKRIQKQDVEKAASIHVRQPIEKRSAAVSSPSPG